MNLVSNAAPRRASALDAAEEFARGYFAARPSPHPNAELAAEASRRVAECMARRVAERDPAVTYLVPLVQVSRCRERGRSRAPRSSRSCRSTTACGGDDPPASTTRVARDFARRSA